MSIQICFHNGHTQAQLRSKSSLSKGCYETLAYTQTSIATVFGSVLMDAASPRPIDCH
ncbi:hypothetical protein AM1_G0005 (plasmid) [Acaryochloris marina MBIC11017]|uniref:Uncharacterized protein n=1 Tax=Acaryochloris marina (strain MBIC 11017) TaxID=329726 RepID=A8ZQ99_ACAM1|nr:hypothetical protein AM1_G0005 [Acaryochloris marina MBIC11017]